MTISRPIAFLALAAVLVAMAALALATPAAVAPAQATIGTVLDVSGAGFGTKPKAYLENVATLKHYALGVSQASDVALRAKVTKGASGAHNVVVVPKGGAALTVGSVELVGPEITNVIPGKPEPGAAIVVASPTCGTKKGKVYVGSKSVRCKWNGAEGRIDFKLPGNFAPGQVLVTVVNSLGQSSPYAIVVVPRGSSKGSFDGTFGGVHWATVPTAPTDDLWFTTNGGMGAPTGFSLFATHVGKEPKTEYAYTFRLDWNIPANSTFPAVSTAPVTGPLSLGVGSLSYERDRTTKPIAFVGSANSPTSGFQVQVDGFDGETLVGSFTGTAADTNAQFPDIPVSGTFTAHLRKP